MRDFHDFPTVNNSAWSRIWWEQTYYNTRTYARDICRLGEERRVVFHVPGRIAQNYIDQGVPAPKITREQIVLDEANQRGRGKTREILDQGRIPIEQDLRSCVGGRRERA